MISGDIRFCSFAPWNELSGAPLCALDHLDFIDPQHSRSCLLLPSEGPLSELARTRGVPSRVFPLFSGQRSFRFPPLLSIARTRLRFIRSLAAFLRERPTILHLHSLAEHLPYSLAAARLARTPVVVTIHEPWLFLPSVRPGYALLRALRVPAVFLTDIARAQYPRAAIPSEVIPNAFPLPSLPPSPARDGPAVAFVASLSFAKGVDTFLHVALRIRDLGVPARFLLIGPAPSPEALVFAKDFIQNHHLEPTASILGPLPSPREIYPLADILCLPTLRDSFPRTVMEAMAYSLPVVASDVDGIPALVSPETGRLVPPGDVDAFVRALLPLLQDSALRKRLGANGRERATRFSPPVYRQSVLDFYRRLFPAFF